MLDIRNFGAVGDNLTINTAAIQAAIDQCSRERHDGVLITGGEFVTGTIYLKDNVTLHVAAGATLLGSTNIADYATDTHWNMYKNEPGLNRCLIFACGVTCIAIEGHGVIDGRGHERDFPNKDDAQSNRPTLIRLLDCSRIRFRDITLRNPASWTTAWLYCSDIVVDAVTIRSRTNFNGDGLDFDGCRDVRVSNCSCNTSDDSICLQASRADRPCGDVVISNCIFTSQWAGIRIGLLSRGDFFNVTVSNCIFRDISDAGLKIQMCEGGRMENMLFCNLVMQNVPRPIFMTFGQQRACVDAPDQLAPMRSMRGFLFNSIIADSSACGKDSAIIMVGLPGHPIGDVTLHDIHLITGGGVLDAPARPLPDLIPERLKGWWPEYECFEMTVPCHGVYAGHLDGLTIRNCTFGTSAEDRRPAIAFHDVRRLNADGVVAAHGPCRPQELLT